MAIQWRPVTAPKEAQALDLLCFRLGELGFAISIEPIIQIIDMVTIHPMPNEIGLIEGVINVRGRQMPVVDLRRYLNLADPKRTLHTPIILAAVNQRTLGLIVDEVEGVMGFTREQLSDSVDFLPPALQLGPVFDGILSSGTGARVVLNLDRLFTSGRLAAVAQLAEVFKASGDLAGTKQAT
jgi:purine-binding chemotaxis protein CheW